MNGRLRDWHGGRACDMMLEELGSAVSEAVSEAMSEAVSEAVSERVSRCSYS